MGKLTQVVRGIAYAAGLLAIGYMVSGKFFPEGPRTFSTALILLAGGSAPVITAWAVWLGIRWLNHRDDPRHAKPPPDPR